ncbi:MAG: FAD-binding oxidoreductase [Pseudanabaenaceae cyanobacterium]
MNDLLTPIVGEANIQSREGKFWVTPPTQAQMAAVVKLCHDRAWKIAIVGQGSKLHWRNPLAGADLVLSTAKLDRLVDHSQGDLTITVEAGYRFAALQSFLTQYQQCLGIDPPYREQCSIGGVVATGESGSWRHRYNSVRDQILGIKFIRSDGEIVKAGGRVVKNVAGYDLMKLLTGSYGTLGLITEVTFRLYPLPTPRVFYLCQGSAEAMQKLRSLLLRSAITPLSLDLYSPYLLQQLGYQPQWGIGIELAGVAIEFASNLLRDIAQNCGVTPQVVEGDFNRSVAHLLETPGRCKVGVPSAQALEIFAPIADRYPLQIHLGSGLGVLKGDDTWDRQYWQQELAKGGGFLSTYNSPMLSPPLQDLMTKIKQQFDPLHLFNPAGC